ncbi:hypothetical protein [Pontibacterium sp.]|uniref:hypothetical protein n=1 Tax=Pontibacterium sp. TaxID=2036026 RepID=UPI003518E673
MQLNRPMPVLSTEPFRFDPLQQDRGFAQMFQQEMAVRSTTETEANAVMALTGAEESLLSHWEIPDYKRIFNAPEAVMRETAADFERFEERARQVAHEMMRYDIQAMVDIRFGVGGISTRLEDDFLISDLSMMQLWGVEQQIFGWGQSNSRLLQTITGLGVKHSLAMAVSALEREQGTNRQQASAAGMLDDYVRQLMLMAGSSTGFNAVMPYQLGTQGCDLSCALGGEFNPRQASPAELRGAAQFLFQQGRVGIETFSLMTHAHQLLGLERDGGAVGNTSEKVDWVRAFDDFLAQAPLYGMARTQVQLTRESLQSLSVNKPVI